jgi:hypothetical protein
VKDSCMTTNAYGEKVTAHCHYLDICYAYPGPHGEIMMGGRQLSGPLWMFLRDGRRRDVITDPDEELVPPCPECGSPTRVKWAEITGFGERDRRWLPCEITCLVNERHQARSALGELSWPKQLTEEDRVWLRKHLALTAKEAS